MGKLFSWLTINRSYEVALPLEEMKPYLEKGDHKYMYYKKLDENRYQVLAKTSFGTLIVHGMQMKGIFLKLNLEAMDDKRTKVHVSTSIRTELYFITIVLLVIFPLGLFFSEEEKPGYLAILLPSVAIFCFLWFWGIYRAQEIQLLKVLESFFEMKRVD